jgi:hypothetical protein
MRILLDECVNSKLALAFPGDEVKTVTDYLFEERERRLARRGSSRRSSSRSSSRGSLAGGGDGVTSTKPRPRWPATSPFIRA